MVEKIENKLEPIENNGKSKVKILGEKIEYDIYCDLRKISKEEREQIFRLRKQKLIELGMDKDNLEKLISEDKSILYRNINKKIKDFKNIGIDESDLSKILKTKQGWKIFTYSIYNKIEEFKKLGINKTQLGIAIKKSIQILDVNIDNKIKEFKKLGIDEKDLFTIITKKKFSHILTYNVDNNIEEFKKLGIDKIQLGQIIQKYPSLFGLNIQNLIKKFEIYGINENELGKLIIKFSPIAWIDLDNKIEEFKKLGIEKDELISFIKRTPRLLSSNLDNKIKQFSKFGINKKDLGDIIRKNQSILGYKIDNKIKIAFYLNTLFNYLAKKGNLNLSNKFELRKYIKEAKQGKFKETLKKYFLNSKLSRRKFNREIILKEYYDFFKNSDIVLGKDKGENYKILRKNFLKFINS